MTHRKTTPATTLDLSTHSHRRFNPLARQWVLVSPNRTERPWLGQVEAPSKSAELAYDPDCYMCPGNSRASGVRNPAYDSTLIFDNDYPALAPESVGGGLDRNGLLIARAESGICRVACYSPRHDVTISRMSRPEIRRVIDVWTAQVEELGSRPDISYVQVFENHGALMGASNPHPHGQIWATASVPDEPAKEQIAQQDYGKAHHACVLCAYLEIERSEGVRMIFENSHFCALVPFWAVWPFETLVLPRRHLGTMTKLASEQRDALADMLKRLTTRYDNLFNAPFPYTMGFHQCPADGQPHDEWHLHAHFYPPLLRSATVRKFMVGFEMLGTPQRDITPETAAARLREVKDQ